MALGSAHATEHKRVLASRVIGNLISDLEENLKGKGELSADWQVLQAFKKLSENYLREALIPK